MMDERGELENLLLWTLALGRIAALGKSERGWDGL